MVRYWRTLVVVALAWASAGHTQEVPSYYADKDRGWYWKEPIPDESKPTLHEATETPPSALVPIEAGPAPFTPAWMRDQLPKYRDIAIANPTTENVKAYFLLQRYSMDMAERFALVAQQVVLGDPMLDENTRRPTSTFGAEVFDSVARQHRDELVKQIGATAGIWYFYKSDCPYCKAQNPIIDRLAKQYDLTILPVALDGQPMPDGMFPNFVADRGHAEQLSVTQTPTLFLVRGPDQFVLLSEGVVAEEGLKTRIISAAHQVGWISDDQYNSTRPVNPTMLTVDADQETPTQMSPDEILSLLKLRQ